VTTLRNNAHFWIQLQVAKDARDVSRAHGGPIASAFYAEVFKRPMPRYGLNWAGLTCAPRVDDSDIGEEVRRAIAECGP
jgi:hypothetical protein